MSPCATTRYRIIAYTAITVIALIGLTAPKVPRIVVGGLVGFADLTERTPPLRLPSHLLDHRHCFSLDRFDPTCPQCM